MGRANNVTTLSSLKCMRKHNALIGRLVVIIGRYFREAQRSSLSPKEPKQASIPQIRQRHFL